MVVEHGQVAPGTQDVAPVVAEERLRGRPDAKPFAEFLRAAMGNPGDLGGESPRRGLFLSAAGFRESEGASTRFVPKLLEAFVQHGLYVFPDGEGIRSQIRSP